MDNYDNVTIGDYVTELYFKQNLVASDAFNDAYRLELDTTKDAHDSDVNNIGSNDTSNVYLIVKPGTVQIQTIGQDGKPQDVSNGFGLGIKQHDDVMLAYGYSHFTRHQVSIPDSEFLIIRLNTNGINQHHVEERVVRTRNESCQFKLYDVTGNEGLFPASPVAMPIFNQQYGTKEMPNPSGTPGTDLLGEFYSFTPVAADPFAALTPIDDTPLWIAATNPVNTRPDDFPNVKGRHYAPDRTYAVVIENLNGSATEVYYQYDWHEY